MERSRAGVLAKERGERPRQIIERLNDLLEAERGGAEATSGLIPRATTPVMGRLFEKLRDDEAWSCAGLSRIIRHLGGKVSPGKGGLAQKLEALPSLRERLSVLNRGQICVVKRLDRLLEEPLDRETGSFLRQMRSLHAENVHRCEDLITTLTTLIGEPAETQPGSPASPWVSVGPRAAP